MKKRTLLGWCLSAGSAMALIAMAVLGLLRPAAWVGTCAELLLVFVLGVEGLVAMAELDRAAEDHRSSNIIAILQQTAEHNWRIIGDLDRCKVIEETEGLSVCGRSQDERTEYWATRAAHLSHIYLLWEVWELAGRPPELTGEHDGWNRFAKMIARKLATAAPPPDGTPSQWAAHDLWKGLHTYEPHCGDFVAWLGRCARPTPAPHVTTRELAV